MPKKTIAQLRTKNTPPTVTKKKAKKILARAHDVADTLDMTTPPNEKVRTSLMLGNATYRQAKQAARAMDLSFNAYVTLALHTLMRGSYAPARPDAPSAGPITIVSHAQRPRNKHMATALERLGDGFTLPGEGEDEECFCPWPKVAAYAKAQRKDPEADFITLGKRLGLTMNEARAADIAQSTQEFEDWMELTHGR